MTLTGDMIMFLAMVFVAVFLLERLRDDVHDLAATVRRQEDEAADHES